MLPQNYKNRSILLLLKTKVASPLYHDSVSYAMPAREYEYRFEDGSVFSWFTRNKVPNDSNVLAFLPVHGKKARSPHFKEALTRPERCSISVTSQGWGEKS